MEEFKGSQRPIGEAVFYWKQNEQGIETDCGVNIKGYSVCRAPRYQTKEQWESDAKLICEAFNVVTRTGLTPEQMEKEIATLKDDVKTFGLSAVEISKEKQDLEARLKEAIELIEYARRFSDSITLAKVDTFLTKEKTK